MKKGNVTGASTYASSGLTLDEACKILNVKPPQAAAAGEAQLETVMERFKKLFDINDPEKGGSFYLQSKILRARERIEMELRETERKATMEKELKEGWKPKVYKDRWSIYFNSSTAPLYSRVDHRQPDIDFGSVEPDELDILFTISLLRSPISAS